MASARTVGSSALSTRPAAQPKRRAHVPTPQEQRRIEHKRRLDQQRKREQAQKREAQQRALARREAFKKCGILAYVCALFCVLSLVVVGYARVAALKMENNDLTGQIQSYTGQIDDLELELSRKTDLQYIREQAKERLNMGYPKAYQVLEIELADEFDTTTAGGNGSSQSGLVATANNVD